jgi:hypothetical protein
LARIAGHGRSLTGIPLAATAGAKSGRRLQLASVALRLVLPRGCGACPPASTATCSLRTMRISTPARDPARLAPASAESSGELVSAAFHATARPSAARPTLALPRGGQQRPSCQSVAPRVASCRSKEAPAHPLARQRGGRPRWRDTPAESTGGSNRRRSCGCGGSRRSRTATRAPVPGRAKTVIGRVAADTPLRRSLRSLRPCPATGPARRRPMALEASRTLEAPQPAGVGGAVVFVRSEDRPSDL